MITIEEKRYFTKRKHIWFSESPFDVTNCDAVFFRACNNNVTLPGFDKKEAPTLIINLENNIESIWKNMGKKSCRYFIKRAVREEVEVKRNTDPEAFLDLYFKFARLKKFKTWHMKLDTLKRHGTLFAATYRGEIIAGIVLLEETTKIRWLFGGSKRLEVDKKKSVIISCANRLLLWEAIKYAKNKGQKEFDFGGYFAGENNKESPQYKINQFKKQFGGTLVVHYNYIKYYSKFYALMKKIAKIKG
jgi:lipid II:glycine glycyltransferase (peptidoglycan interpeptide bridge formation enzyme)